MNLDFLAGEMSQSGNILVGDPNALTVDAEDAAHNHYSLKVEYVAQVPPLLDSQGNITTDFRGLYMVIVRLNDSMTSNLGDVLLRLNLHGMSSNRVRMAIGAIGGGPADDPGAVPTPAPATPPTPIMNPQTIAQYQAQFANPAFPSDQDLRRFLEQASWGLRLSRFRALSTVLSGQPASAGMRRHLCAGFLLALSASEAVHVECSDAAGSVETAGIVCVSQIRCRRRPAVEQQPGILVRAVLANNRSQFV